MQISNNEKPALCWLFVFLIFGLVSCDSEKNQTNNNDKIRIITLSPHLAELAYSAGAQDNLVGVSSYSDFPEQVKAIQKIGDAFKLDYEAIISLQPDYILTWKGGTPVAAVEKLKSLKLNIIETEINNLADIPSTIAQISELTNTQKLAKPQIDLFNEKLNKLKNTNRIDKTAFIQTFHQPLYTISGKHWMSQAIAICGYQNIFKDLPQLSAPVTLESVISKNPQTIINISKQKDLQWQKWQNLEAVKNQQIITLDPDLFSRPSMRLLDGIEGLCNY